jgi:hypothetical protein
MTAKLMWDYSLPAVGGATLRMTAVFYYHPEYPPISGRQVKDPSDFSKINSSIRNIRNFFLKFLSFFEHS